MTATTYTAFIGTRRLAAGAPWEVALEVRDALARDATASVLTFDDRTGRQIDFDLRGDDTEIVARLRPEPEPEAAPSPSVGRPRLGVVAREVTLLPRHWDWLGEQPGSASAVLRRLVDEARKANADSDRVRAAQAAADRFMRTLLGDEAGYEEAARALYAGDGEAFRACIARWPAEARAYLERLAAPALDDEHDAAP